MLNTVDCAGFASVKLHYVLSGKTALSAFFSHFSVPRFQLPPLGVCKTRRWGILDVRGS